MQHSSVIWVNKKDFFHVYLVFFSGVYTSEFRFCHFSNKQVIIFNISYVNISVFFSSEIAATALPRLMKSSSSRSFILDSQGRQWSCDTCWTYTMMSVNIWSSGSHIVCPGVEELPCQSGAQMWNLIAVGSPCRRRWAPAKARPGIHHTLPSKACGYNTEQMSACLCSAPLAPDFFLLFFKNKKVEGESK